MTGWMTASPPVLADPGPRARAGGAAAGRADAASTTSSWRRSTTTTRSSPRPRPTSPTPGASGSGPLLTLLAAELGTGVSDEVVAAAAGVELTHLASLYHDDVMDEAEVRRGVPERQREVRQLDGDPHRRPALRQGVRARRRARRRGGPHPGADLRAAVRRADPRRPPRPAGRRPGRATTSACSPTRPASLIATAARYGAMFGGAPTDVVELMADYGEKLGVAFQLADDLIDISSDAAETGKTPGTDLREGVRHPAGAATPVAGPTRPTPGCSSCWPATCATTTGTPRLSRCCGPTRRSSRPARPPAASAPRRWRCSPRCRSRRPRRPCTALVTSVVDRVG